MVIWKIYDQKRLIKIDIDLQSGNISCELEGVMHERERHQIILSAVQERTVATVAELVELTDSSEATIRRDIAAMHQDKRVRRVRGGAEALLLPQQSSLIGRPFSVNEAINAVAKKAIAREAVALCEEGDDIIINGGTTTFQMVHGLATRRLQVLTNSLPIAEHLASNSRVTLMLAGGTLYREQNIILSPFDDGFTMHFSARRMFMGAHSIGRLGLMESDPLVIQGEQRLMGQADELVVLVDSSKFHNRSSLVFCALEKIDVLITDDGIDDASAAMIEAADIRLVVAELRSERDTASGTSPM